VVNGAEYLRHFIDPETSWYRSWYLELRLEEEMLRSIRYERSLSLILFGLRDLADCDDDQKEDLALIMQYVVNTRLRATDIAGLLDDGSYAVILPETPLTGAHVVAARVVEDLADYMQTHEVRHFPEDGASLRDLLRRDGSASNVVDFTLFKGSALTGA
jgi:hypothetical protein